MASSSTNQNDESTIYKSIAANKFCMKVILFGDSESAENIYFGFKKWPTRLRESRPSELSIYNLATISDTSKDLLKRAETEIKPRKRKLDIIITMVGSNDSWLGKQSLGHRPFL